MAISNYTLSRNKEGSCNRQGIQKGMRKKKRKDAMQFVRVAASVKSNINTNIKFIKQVRYT